MLDYGPDVALGLPVVWLVLLYLSVRSDRKIASFNAASMFIGGMVTFFWLAPEIIEVSISHIGTFRTNAELATKYFDEIKSIHAKVETEAAAVASIQKQASEQLEYWDDARLSASGSELIGSAGILVSASGDIFQILAPYVHPAADLSGRWDCKPAALDAYNKAISYDGKYPFAYYYRATCRKAEGAGDWRQDIQKAREILLITTRLPVRHPDHAALLKRINDVNLTNN